MGVSSRASVYFAGTALAVVAAAGVISAVSNSGRGTVTVPAHDAGPQLPPAADRLGKPIGVAGCAAAACHGGPGTTLTSAPDQLAWRCAATTWLAADPHTRAYAVLSGPLATRMMVLLSGEKSPGKPNTPATEDLRCLACHTNPGLVKPDAAPEIVALRSEGVSCEACHGNAGGWVSAHTARNEAANWDRDRAGLRALGLTDLNDVGERALACAGCHVGAPAGNGYPVRDMNHDMIAAGHPRLNFDFADYLHRLPAHWHEVDRSKADMPPRGPDFEARAWLVGRVAHAEAACKLLESRAERAVANDARTPWPEFAEFNCFACHHELTPATWQMDKPGNWREAKEHYAGRTPGLPGWQTIWPVARYQGIDRDHGGNAFESLLGMMQKSRPPDRNIIKGTAGHVAGQMTGLRQRLATMPEANLNLVATRLMNTVKPDELDWDEAVQVWAGLAALERAKLRQGQPPTPGFAESLEKLRLKPGANSPRTYTPAEARDALAELLKSVGP